jgi:hypothetical protein
MRNFGILFSALVASMNGCGSNGPKTHDLTGKVTLAGQPVEVGVISFEGATNGFSNSTELKAGGTYQLQLAEGSYTVTLFPKTEETIAADGTPDTVPIDDKKFPKRYRASSSSQLVLDIKGDATFDVDMKPK